MNRKTRNGGFKYNTPQVSIDKSNFGIPQEQGVMPLQMPQNFQISQKPTVIVNKQGIRYGKYQNHTLNNIDFDKLGISCKDKFKPAR